ncbi:hypothetical protein Egran_06613 [Elaphomyces granulatus]|uniref:Glycosyl transferase n=1 Tax=Elaphomyces granulatus TaxID=519963 RepID=A0A232LN95_9EURO|nr:hypothetical protein Egran_06613 [Elaphomyces granulatus]
MTSSLRIPRWLLFFTCTTFVFLLYRWWFFPLIRLTFGLAALPVRWKDSSSPALITRDRDQFDVTFASYAVNQTSAAPEYDDLVPSILHHINLGSRPPRDEWVAARSQCLRYHEGWDFHLWDDASANAFVQDHFPHLKNMWDSYPYPVQRVDALRYMVLYKYGGVVLDFDLACKRSLGPLRRFDFVAPAAHPTGFSIGMLLASPNNTFVDELVHNLPIYNRYWFFLPYVTVMFSTGCHYASTLYTLQPHRAALRILAGTNAHPRLHMLNGFVETPLFRHLGTSSWHSFDAIFINMIGNSKRLPLLIFLVVASFVAGSLAAVYATMRIRARCSTPKTCGTSPDLKGAYKNV